MNMSVVMNAVIIIIVKAYISYIVYRYDKFILSFIVFIDIKKGCL